MRRTYGSKKDTTNVVERRDLFQNLDEKSTAYNAFSIQNIKQTKRELTCFGSSNPIGVTSSRVRKKKYVKRIIKEVELPCRESISNSAYLTPDKSIRVNKVLDPFDLLLISSPAVPIKAADAKPESATNELDLFDQVVPKKECKTYIRRKPRRTKKLNYASTESSDSDKENSDKQNITDIRTHKLLVEREVVTTPNKIDESINKIVNNLSLLHRLKHQYNTEDSLNKSLRLNRHRLTKTIQSPLLQKSPFCSTPFKVKYRDESIFKFSPIAIADSPNTIAVEEDNDDSNHSIILQSKSKSSVEEKTTISDKLDPVDKVQVDVNDEPEIDDNEDIVNTEKYESLKQSPTVSDSNTMPSIEISSKETTEIEPFLGFSDHPSVGIIESKDQNASLSNDTILRNDVTEIEVSGYHPDLNSHNNDMVSENYGDNSQYLDDNQNDIYEDNAGNRQSNVSINANTDLDDDDHSDIIEASEDNNVDDIINSNIDLCEDHTVCVDASKERDDDNFSDQSADSDSLYDTCTSEQSSTQDTEEIKEPVVLLERMNDSSFFRYYDKVSQNTENESTTSENTDADEISLNADFASINDSSDSKQTSENSSDNETELNNVDDNYEIESMNENNDSSNNNEEEKCVSFITTRRRNKVTNNSMILMFNDLDCSTSTDCDKTVLSNNMRKTETSNIDNNDTLLNFDADLKDDEKVDDVIDLRKDSEHSDDPTEENSSSKPRKSSIKPKNSLKAGQSSQFPKLQSKSIRHDPDSSRMSCFDTKLGIVLQPGKKWERSLSIYRRMTMMNDHFDHSMLDETDTASKGRKYRQSIISTMEMQDFNSSLHNESINSRRSTFVSKPTRSTIVILKDPTRSRYSLSNTTVFDDLNGFLNEECDDTIIELSKLSIADQTHEVTVLDNFHDTPNRIATAKDYVLRRCNQSDAILFDECYPDTVLKNCHKIGEGVYGEVFLWRDRDGRARVLKIVPIAGNLKVNGESQKDFHEIISEIVIAMELSALRAPIADIERHFNEGKDVEALDLHAIENASDIFNEVLAVRCVYGSYPSRLLDLWDLYDECKGSENDNPAILPLDQQFIVLELANAGLDLESYQFNNAEQAHALFLQVAYGLAVAEEAFQFEHRDLHWGNVLISPTEQKFATFVIRGRLYRVPRCGVSATIIDYSLSRVSLRLAAGDCAALYNDLATDESLFDAVGDYQFQVYRLMRDKLGNDWKNFEPYTNILWLHYTVDKMITALRYKRTNTKIHKHYIDKLKGIKSRILEYGSAAQFVLTDNEI